MSKKMPKISIIVSVYNTEKYLEKCINSLIKQTYQNIEVVIIEDGSTDNSKEILKKYEKNKKCVISYNEKNNGLSYSRNKGMELSSGDYLGFIDSDDYVDETYYEKLMNAIIKNDAEISICDMKLIYEYNNTFQISKCYEKKFNVLSVVNNGLAASACNKLFKKSLITKYRFAVGKVNEDIAVVIPALVNAKKIAYAEDCYYNYIQREGSIQNSRFSMKKFDIFDGIDDTLIKIKKNEEYEKLKDALIFNQIIVLLLYVIPKEKKFFYRNKILKIYYKKAKKYDIRSNIYYWLFLENCGKKHNFYYKLLFKLECNGLCLLANLLLLAYDILVKIFKKSIIKNNISMNDLIKCASIQNKMKKTDVKVSVVIPNYNYSNYLMQRIYSILNQNYKIYELIILDDCSKDNSRELIDNIYNKLNRYINIKKVYNEKNSGSAFKQWEKGFEMTTGDYVWIAEADDYCEKNMLGELLKPVEKDKDVVISYSDTAFINIFGAIMIKSIKPEIDIQKSGHWNRSYVINGIEEIKKYSFLNNTIANVSSCIIKKNDYSKIFNEAGKYKQAGDWYFYVNVISTGKIAYTDKVLNYYRVHGNNISSTMDHQKHIDEINSIYKYCIEKFKLEKIHIKKMEERIKFLKKVWKI